MQFNPTFIYNQICHYWDLKEQLKIMGYYLIQKEHTEDGRFTVFDAMNEGNNKKYIKNSESLQQENNWNELMFRFVLMKESFEVINRDTNILINAIDGGKKLAEIQKQRNINWVEVPPFID